MKEVCSVLSALFAGCKESEAADRTDGATSAAAVSPDKPDDIEAGLPPGVRIMHTHSEFI